MVLIRQDFIYYYLCMYTVNFQSLIIHVIDGSTRTSTQVYQLVSQISFLNYH